MNAPPAPTVTLSCVVPTFADPALAERCLSSILAQSLSDLEVIVVDDSPDDGVRSVVDRLARGEPRLTWREGARTAVAADNWNLGLAQARGRWIVLVHHDEAFCDPGALARATARLAARPDTVFVLGTAVEGGSRFAVVSRLARRLQAPAWTLFAANWVGPTAAVVFPAVLGLRFDPRFVWLADVDFYHRLWRRTGRFQFDSRVSVVSRPHAGQITAGLETLERHRLELAALARSAGGPLAPWQEALARGWVALRARPARRRRMAAPAVASGGGAPAGGPGVEGQG